MADGGGQMAADRRARRLCAALTNNNLIFKKLHILVKKDTLCNEICMCLILIRLFVG